MAEGIEIIINATDRASGPIRAVNSALGVMDKTAMSSGKSLDTVGKQANKMGGFLSQAAASAAGFAVSAVAMNVVGGVFNKVTGAIIGMNASLETST